MAGKLFWFLTKYAGGPLIGSGPLVLFAGSQGEKGWRMDRLAGGKSQRPGRGGGAHPSASLLPRVSIPPSAQRRLPGGMQEAALALVETPAGGGGWARSALKERARGQRPQVRSFVWQAEGAAPRAAPSAAKRRRRSVRRSVRRGRRRSGAGGHRPRPRNMPAAGLARQRAGGLCPPAAFAVRKGRCASPLKRLPSTPLLTGLPPRFFRHWRRSALPPCRF